MYSISQSLMIQKLRMAPEPWKLDCQMVWIRMPLMVLALEPFQLRFQKKLIQMMIRMLMMVLELEP
jgi:hypothetical protein